MLPKINWAGQNCPIIGPCTTQLSRAYGYNGQLCAANTILGIDLPYAHKRTIGTVVKRDGMFRQQ
eukprot:682687-Amphidinium_carterae.1